MNECACVRERERERETERERERDDLSSIVIIIFFRPPSFYLSSYSKLATHDEEKKLQTTKAHSPTVSGSDYWSAWPI